MKFGSVLKLSFHNLFNNKLRTLLTCIVLFVMATVVMILSAFGINFYASALANIEKTFQDKGSSFSVSNKANYTEAGNHYASEREVEIAPDVAKEILAKLDNEKNPLFSFVYMSGSALNVQMKNLNTNMITILSWEIQAAPLYAKSSPAQGVKDFLVSGRLWNVADEDTNNIWLDESLIESYNLGDKIVFESTRTDSNHNPERVEATANQVFTVCGFVKEFKTGRWNNECARRVYFSAKYFNGKAPSVQYHGEREPSSFYITSVGGVLTPQADFIYSATTQKRFKQLNKTYDICDFDKTDGFSVTCPIVDDLEMADMMLLIVMVVIIILSTIIILLSIGCVSNTIKITVEQNRKFFGMMKAIGMQNKTVRAVVQWQAVIMTLISVLLSSALVAGLVLAMKGILTSLTSMMFGNCAIVICSLSPYIPLVTFFALIGFVLLFTRSSLMKISKMDVISVISEVN
ncbi:MAG: ABC transporter permease [Clostridia bacterium]